MFNDIASCAEWSGEIKTTGERAFGCLLGLALYANEEGVYNKEKDKEGSCANQPPDSLSRAIIFRSGASVTSDANCRRQVNVDFTATMTERLAPAAEEASKTINVVTLALAINTVIDALGLNGTLSYLNASSIEYVGSPVVSTIIPGQSNSVEIATGVICVVGVLGLTSALAFHFVKSEPRLADDPTQVHRAQPKMRLP